MQKITFLRDLTKRTRLSLTADHLTRFILSKRDTKTLKPTRKNDIHFLWGPVVYAFVYLWPCLCVFLLSVYILRSTYSHIFLPFSSVRIRIVVFYNMSNFVSGRAFLFIYYITYITQFCHSTCPPVYRAFLIPKQLKVHCSTKIAFQAIIAFGGHVDPSNNLIITG